MAMGIVPMYPYVRSMGERLYVERHYDYDSNIQYCVALLLSRPLDCSSGLLIVVSTRVD